MCATVLHHVLLRSLGELSVFLRELFWEFIDLEIFLGLSGVRFTTLVLIFTNEGDLLRKSQSVNMPPY